ncbi:MAG: cytochrome c [Sorangiineae bacterium]|nr:cytochrome c [Polyangiaceae bacterium]MEB2324405.1 cytochrome c [Sorangiineae bacterium]
MARRIVIWALLTFAVASACAPPGGAPPPDAALIEARLAQPYGAKVFNLRCASCHGEVGNAPGYPVVMGPGALQGFADQESLCEYIAAYMPPGSSRLAREDAQATCDYLGRIARVPRRGGGP